jgi:hypothetical protein
MGVPGPVRGRATLITMVTPRTLSGVEQLVARRPHKPEVVGSKPTAATKGVAPSHARRMTCH